MRFEKIIISYDKYNLKVIFTFKNKCFYSVNELINYLTKNKIILLSENILLSKIFLKDMIFLKKGFYL